MLNTNPELGSVLFCVALSCLAAQMFLTRLWCIIIDWYHCAWIDFFSPCTFMLMTLHSINQLILVTRIGGNISALPYMSSHSESQITWMLEKRPLIKEIQGFSRFVASHWKHERILAKTKCSTVLQYRSGTHVNHDMEIEKWDTAYHNVIWWWWIQMRNQKSRKATKIAFHSKAVLNKNFLSLITGWEHSSGEEKIKHCQWLSR